MDAAGEPRVGRGNLKLDGQFIRDVANRGEGVGEIFARVSRRDAEANAWVVDGRGRGPDDDDRELAVKRQPGEVPDLVRLVEHHRHDGRRVVTEHLQTERLQPLAEKLGVFAELPELLSADVRAVLPGDDPQGREDLGAHGRGHGARVHATRRVLPDPRDGFVIRRDVSTGGAKRLGERPHHDVHVLWVHAELLAHAPAGGPHGTDRVRLVEPDVGSVELANLDNLRKAAQLTLHGVDALDDNQDLVVPLLARHGVLEDELQVADAVVLERPHLGAA